MTGHVIFKIRLSGRTQKWVVFKVELCECSCTDRSGRGRIRRVFSPIPFDVINGWWCFPPRYLLVHTLSPPVPLPYQRNPTRNGAHDFGRPIWRCECVLGVCVGGVGVWRSLLSNRPFTNSTKQNQIQRVCEKRSYIALQSPWVR